MLRESQSGDEPDRRHWGPDWVGDNTQSPRPDPRPPDTRVERDDPLAWIASLPDFEGDAESRRERQAKRSGDEWLHLPDASPQTELEGHGNGDPASRATGDWVPVFSDGAPAVTGTIAALLVDSEGLDTDPHGGAARGGASGRDRASRPASRRRLLIVAAVIALIVTGAGGFVALSGRSGSKSGPTAATSAPSITTGVTSTVASTAGSTTPTPVPRPAPSSFTVRSTCGPGACTVTVRGGPGRTSKPVGSLRAGQGVEIECSTHGEPVQETDLGEQSDIWYRQAGTSNYVSALYLDGPAVPSCT
jgi:hypothetical protein